MWPLWKAACVGGVKTGGFEVHQWCSSSYSNIAFIPNIPLDSLWRKTSLSMKSHNCCFQSHNILSYSCSAIWFFSIKFKKQACTAVFLLLRALGCSSKYFSKSWLQVISFFVAQLFFRLHQVCLSIWTCKTSLRMLLGGHRYKHLESEDISQQDMKARGELKK